MTAPDKKIILIVDDEMHITHVLAFKLEREGFGVVVANDGETALELARAQSPDLIITDLQMPIMDGLEMCAKLRDDPAT